MKAMTYRGPYKIRVDSKPDPVIEHPNDAIVRVELAAICGSDLHLYHGMMPDTRVGHTFGHEFIGTVEQVGGSVQNLKVGDRVMVPFNIYCGSCFFCARGLFSNCHNVNANATATGGIYGYSHTCGGYDGGQAELVRVPFADVGPSSSPTTSRPRTRSCSPTPSRRDTSARSSPTSPRATPSWCSAPARWDSRPRARAGSWAPGGSSSVDYLDYRLRKAHEFAFAEPINFGQVDDIVRTLKKETDGLGADVVIDAVGAEADGHVLQHVASAKLKLQGGSPVAVNWAIDSVRKGGTVSIMGAYGPLFSAVKLGDAMNKGLTIRTNQAPVKRQWPRLFEHIRAGHIKPSGMITHRIPLDHIAEGYHLFSSKLDDIIKPVITPAA